MHPLIRELLSGWEWRPEVLAILIPLSVMYFVGWRRLRRQSTRSNLANGWRLASYQVGLGIIALSLMSPIARLGGQLFFMHMVQHMLMMMFAAPLLLMADPFPMFAWSLPAKMRKSTIIFFERDSIFRRGLIKVTKPGVAWLLFLTVYLGWHDPNAYNLSLTYEWAHNTQHISFFIASLIWWWPLIECAPYIHPRFPIWGKLAYIIGTIPPNMAIGVSIAFSGEILYTYYQSVPRVWGFSTLEDQQFAGAIMWIQGSEMYIMITIFFLARTFMRKNKGKPPIERTWDTEEVMIAPGLEDRVSQNRWRKVVDNKTNSPTDISQPT